MDNIEKLCCYYVALLRCAYLVHQNHHWITKGPNFYGNHLLFERIYKSATEDADLAAEKFIGLFGEETLNLQLQAQMIGKTLEKYTSEDLVSGSLRAEKDFLEFSEKFYLKLKSSGQMSLGLDDMIMSIASNREGACYLLNQIKRDSLDEIDEKNMKISARIKFLKRLGQIQTDTALGMQKQINQDISLNLGNRNWGAVGVKNLAVTESAPNIYTAQYDVIVPVNSPPFVDKKKYPGGLNQFKQEMMNIVNQSVKKIDPDAQLTHIIKVNDQEQLPTV